MQNSYKILYFTLLSLILSSEPFADYKIGKNYFINKIESEISIDGLMTESVWSEIDSIGEYTQDFPYNNEKPSFKTAERCLIPFNGWYEWKRSGNQKTPYFFHQASKSLYLVVIM